MIMIGIVISFYCCMGMVTALDFDVAKLPNGLTFANSPLFQNIFKKDGNLTSFGRDFMNNNYAWNTDLCMKDSDGDGLTNGDELGDPCCSWYYGGPPTRRYNLKDLSDPGNNSSVAPFPSASSVASIYNFRAIPTYHSVLLKWKMPDVSASTICYIQIQMSTLNAVGYTTITYKSYNVNNFTRYNLDENKTYSFRILPYNKFTGYNSYGIGNQAIIFTTTKLNPYGHGIGDNCPSQVIKWSEFDNSTFNNSTSDNSTIANDNSTIAGNSTTDNNSTVDGNSTIGNSSTTDSNNTSNSNSSNIDDSQFNSTTNCTTEITREDIYDCYATEHTTECYTNSTFDGFYYTNHTDCVIFTHIDSFTCDSANCSTCSNGDAMCISVTNSNCSNTTYISENVTSVVCNQITVNTSTVCSLNRTIFNVTNCYGDNSTFILVNNTLISHNSTNSTTNSTNNYIDEEEEDDSLYLEPERILVVPENYTVILDVIPPKLDVVHVFGCLVFSDELDLEMHFKSMIVTGSLQIGNETSPHQHNATITLHGERNLNRTLIGFGVKNIIVTSGGALSLHGKKHEVSWTLLGKSAQVGDTSVHLKQPTEWQVGDEIVLASTDYYHNQAERRTISVRFNSTCFGFVKPLVYGHYANTEYYQKANGTVVTFDERGEVGLLSHNIKIRGDLATSEDSMFGGHTAFLRTAQYVRLDNVEFTRMGQAGIPGRYPIYFQLFGDANTSYVHKVSVYDTYQRAVALQGTNYLHVEGVVAFNIYGHTFFLEDGAEQYNIFENNLGILSKVIPDSRSVMLPDNQDNNPATFYITNPNNIFIGNRAAGSDAFGFWYHLDSYATGASQTPYIRPNRWYWGQFVNNTAHSNNQHGMMLYPNFYTCTNPKMEMYDSTNCGTDKNPWSEPVFENMNIWKNRQNGQYSHVQGKLNLKGSIFADNPVSYTVLNIIMSPIVVSGAIFIGFTQNKGNPNNCNDGQCYRCGTDYKNPSSPYYRSLPSYSRNDPFIGVLYHRDGNTLLLQDLEFFDFVDNCERKLSSIDLRNDDWASMNQGDYVTNRMYFHNANVMYLLAGLASKESSLSDVYRHEVIIDTDGTLSRNITVPSKIRRAGARIIPSTMIMVDPILCAYVKEWNAFICDESVNFKRFEITTPAITNGIDRARVNSTNGYSEKLNGRLQYWGEWWYRALYMDYGIYRYSIDWLGVVGTPEKIRLDWQGSTTLSVSIGFVKWGPLKVKIEFTDGSPTRNLSPSNFTDGLTTYDCKNNIVTLPVKKEATVYIEEATYVPPGSNCVAVIDTDLCANRSSCGGAKRGKCVGPNECVCRWGWYTETCSSFHCVHRNWCGGRGTCVGPNTCACFPGFGGSDCSLVHIFDLVNKVLAFGDIHLRTVDAAEYTFNSIGEFYLYKSNELGLQGRLMKCTADSKTSCMKGISFMSGSDKVSILSDGKTGVKVLVNDVQVYLNETKVNVQPVEADTKFEIPKDLQKLVEQIKGQVDPDTNQVANITESQLVYKEPDTPILVLNGGATITQEDDTSSYYMVNGLKFYYKSITVKYSGDFKGQIKLRNDGLGWLAVSFAPSKDVNFTGTELGGLYGTLDGNKDNEFTLRDGTVLPSPTAEQIHQVFGESWRISKNESFFTYTVGSQYEDLNVLDFKPIMKASSENATLQALAEKACNSLGLTASFYESCMFDVLSTGLVEYAMASATAVAQDSCSNNGSCTAVLVCPNFCSLNGKCLSGVCKCDLGYLGEDCSIPVTYINLVGIIVGSVIGGYVAVLFVCVSSIIALIIISRRYKVQNVTRMVSIVPTLDHRDELRSVCSADYEDQRIEMLDRTMGTITFKRE
ncbi:predicted protein [Naegleria gruberi]|uniref:Predicted protein n=1 Tax=Naegleria gruberi TaxID=5762 RepID=D2VQN5_NAEGR|nr:uncharacterized protein NAEGRDRAFT_71289 [Naegleria gruberi]EFC40979.1 predicted protein [Naegleria gruberi]|eukprot:XP_002673723.1 predicted protein [Naegleria gruberi strain NEG-M]